MQVRVPADAYNAAGFTDVKMANPRWLPGTRGQNRRQGDRRQGSRSRGRDMRQFVRNTERPPPGDPAAPEQPMHELRWTLVCDMEYTVRRRRPQAGASGWPLTSGHACIVEKDYAALLTKATQICLGGLCRIPRRALAPFQLSRRRDRCACRILPVMRRQRLSRGLSRVPAQHGQLSTPLSTECMGRCVRRGAPHPAAVLPWAA